MARFNGKANFDELKELQKRFEELTQNDIDNINEDLVKTKAALFLRNVILLTPTGDYDNGQVGGTLRRGWTTESEREAQLSSTFGGAENAKKYVNTLLIKKFGGDYEIDIVNNVKYASYVNYGHRAGKTGYVNGKFFVEKALSQTEISSKRVLNKRLNKLLKEALNGD